MPKDDGQTADLCNSPLGTIFVFRIERAEVAGYGDGVYLVLDAFDLFNNIIKIKGVLFAAIEVVSPVNIKEMGG